MGDCAATLGATGYTTQQTLSEVWHNKFRSFLSFDNGLIAVLSETHATSALKLLVQAIKGEIDHIRSSSDLILATDLKTEVGSAGFEPATSAMSRRTILGFLRRFLIPS